MRSGVKQSHRLGEETVCLLLFKGRQMVHGEVSVTVVNVVLSDPLCRLQTSSLTAQHQWCSQRRYNPPKDLKVARCAVDMAQEGCRDLWKCDEDWNFLKCCRADVWQVQGSSDALYWQRCGHTWPWHMTHSRFSPICCYISRSSRKIFHEILERRCGNVCSCTDVQWGDWSSFQRFQVDLRSGSLFFCSSFYCKLPMKLENIAISREQKRPTSAVRAGVHGADFTVTAALWGKLQLNMNKNGLIKTIVYLHRK